MTTSGNTQEVAPEPLQPGARVGNYRLLRLLGKGGMGAVYEAVHLYIERRAAIKVLHAQLSQNSEFRARFLNEARAVNLIQHPGLVEVYEFGLLDDGAAYIVMEFLQGEALDARIARSPQGLGHVALSIAWDIAQAMVAAHEKGIVHRDLKPANVMLLGGEGAARLRVKVLDFGIAKMSEENEGSLRTETGAMIGTPAYMAPEQCLSAPNVDGKADVYALGIILYEMLCGRLPFSAKHGFDYMAAHVRIEPLPISNFLPDLPPEVGNLVHSMLVKDPSLRPSMDAVAGLLQELQAAALSLWSGADGAGAEISTRANTEAGVAATVSGASQRPPRHSKEMIEISATAPGSGGARLSRELAVISGQSARVSGSRGPSGPLPVLPSAVSGRTTGSELAPPAPSGESAQPAPLPVAAPASQPALFRRRGAFVAAVLALAVVIAVVGLRRGSGPPERAIPTPAVRQVRWLLTSQPSGAEVVRGDGQVLGSTPFSLVRPADVGETQITLRLSGYGDKSVVLSHNADVETAIVLSPVPSPPSQPAPPEAAPSRAEPSEGSSGKRGKKDHSKSGKRGPGDDVKLLID